MVSSIVNDQTFLFDPLKGPKQVLSVRVRVDLGVKTIRWFSVISRTHVEGVLTLCNDVVG